MTTEKGKELPSKEWEGKPEEGIDIPEPYAAKIKDIRYKIMVFVGRKPFEFQCTDFSYAEDVLPGKSQNALHGLLYTFIDVLMDTSKRDPKGNVTLQRISYHPYIQLGMSTVFMVIPVASEILSD